MMTDRELAIAFCNYVAPQWGPYPNPDAPPLDLQRFEKMREKLARYRWELCDMFHIFALYPPGFETEDNPADIKMFRTLDGVEQFAATLSKTH